MMFINPDDTILMSKQVNHVNMKFCMETGLPPGNYVNPFISCKTDIISNIQYNARCIKNHINNGLAILHGNLSSYMNSKFFVNPFSSDAYQPHKTL